MNNFTQSINYWEMFFSHIHINQIPKKNLKITFVISYLTRFYVDVDDVQLNLNNREQKTCRRQLVLLTFCVHSVLF